VFRIQSKAVRAILRWQIIGTVVAAGIAALAFGRDPALSIALGGGISAAASFVIAAITFRDADRDPRRMLINLYCGEAAKLGLTVVLLIVAFKFVGVQALPFFLAYVATLFVYWISLIGSRAA
jgi:ATP synthase protein I